jgi:hypothetical protein
VSSAQETQADDINVLVDRGANDLFGCPANAGVDDLITCIAQGPDDDLGTSVVSIEADLADENSFRFTCVHGEVLRFLPRF